MSYTLCAKNTTTQPNGSPPDLPDFLTVNLPAGSTPITALSAGMSTSPATTAETGPREYAKQRTRPALDYERARGQLARQVNRELETAIARETAHLQKQVDDKIAWCDACATQCDQSVNHAWRQVELIEQENGKLQEVITKRQEIIARLGAVVAELTAANEPKKKAKPGTPKARQLERQARQLARVMRDEQ